MMIPGWRLPAGGVSFYDRSHAALLNLLPSPGTMNRLACAALIVLAGSPFQLVRRADARLDQSAHPEPVAGVGGGPRRARGGTDPRHRIRSVSQGGTSAALLGTQRSTGSGVILSADGFIVTNAHVVEGGRRFVVVLPRPACRRRSRTLGARLRSRRKCRPPSSAPIAETDLAVLKVALTGLPFAGLGNSDSLAPGQVVLAFGSPFGLASSVTMGVISAVGRQLRDEDRMIYIQTDTPINPGNSGGPLVSADGLVVGINTMIFSQSGGSEGIGFAAPGNIVRFVYEQIRTNRRVQRGEIGVFAQTITPALASGLRLSREWGVVLGDVYPNSPAAKAGLRINDVILSVDGKPMENGRQFDVTVYQRRSARR